MPTNLTLAQQHEWQVRLDKARDGQAETLKASATTWAGYIATLVGAFGAISVVVAPKALADFSNNVLLIVTLVCLVLAGVAGVFALVLAIRAAGKWPEIDATMDAANYHDAVTDQAVNGVNWLRCSRWLTVAAIFLVLIGSVLSVVDTLTAPSKNVNVVVVYKDGSTTCLPVASATNAKTVSSITVVAHC